MPSGCISSSLPRGALISAASRILWPATRLLQTSAAPRHAFDYFPLDSQPSSSQPNAAAAALGNGIPSGLMEFQISTDEAIQRYNAYQAATCKGLQAGGLLGSQPSTTVKSAYFPVWCFTATITAEYKGMLGFREDKGSEAMVWKAQEDWQVLCHKQQLAYTHHPYLQVYASYNYEPSLGAAALLPDAGSLGAARPLTWDEATTLRGPAGRAVLPSRVLSPQQQGPAGVQEPLHKQAMIESHVGTATGAHGPAQQPASLPAHFPTSSAEQASSGPAGSSGMTRQQMEQETRHEQGTSSVGVVIHPPDMQVGIAWQLAYRGLMLELTQQASKAAMQQTKAADSKDMHVTVQVHDLAAQLVYSPVYVARYQYGDRYKQGTATVIMPQMFYACISGLEQGRLVAPAHVSVSKTQAATASLVGGLGLAAGSPSWLGLADPLISVGAVESLTLAVIGGALARMWAQGLPQATRNHITAKQIKAEREFYRQYDARETKTAAAQAAAEAAGTAASSTEAGEQADEYVQWLWLDYDWRRWQYEEPWNWEPHRKREEAEAIAARTVRRRKQRQEYLERLLQERRKREYEQEQEMLRSRAGRRPPRSQRFTVHADQFGRSDQTRRMRDFLGYYKLMGMAEEDDVTSESVKMAFRAQAMLLHPDRVSAAGGDEHAQQEAHVRFQRLQMAYDVLRDPEKRAAYDRGQLVQ